MWPLLSMLVTLPPRAARQACTGRARATPRFGRARASPPTTVVSIYSRDDEPDIPRGGRPTAVAAALCVCRMCVRVLSHVDPAECPAVLTRTEGLENGLARKFSATKRWKIVVL